MVKYTIITTNNPINSVNTTIRSIINITIDSNSTIASTITAATLQPPPAASSWWAINPKRASIFFIARLIIFSTDNSGYNIISNDIDTNNINIVNDNINPDIIVNDNAINDNNNPSTTC